MNKYPKIGIRPTIDGRQGGVRESLEDKTMSLARAVADLISSHVKYSDGTPVECVIADGTIGRVGESAACAEKFERECFRIKYHIPCFQSRLYRLSTLCLL